MSIGTVAVQARRDAQLSRWLWLVKWLLLLPHYVVLAFLWLAFVLVTAVAFVAILITGRYPRSLFDFNLGVIRWTWRVGYYGYSALGTDRYPPFTLAARPDYPATVDVAYPERLSRGLVLVKWWLLVLPHYLILSVLAAGGSAYVADDEWYPGSPSLLGLCVFFAAVALLFTGRYPDGLHGLAMGINRWALRVLAYAALMTDSYPPFRLDQGPDDTPVEPPPSGPDNVRRSTVAPAIALVIGLLLFLSSAALGVAGGAGLWLDNRRDQNGYVWTPDRTLSSGATAITVEDIDLDVDPEWGPWSDEDYGQIRIRAVPTGERPVFVGIGRETDVDDWLRGTAHDELRGFRRGDTRYVHRDGDDSASPPVDQAFWAASASGTGTRELTWTPETGRWAAVIANPDGDAGVRARVGAGVHLPPLAAAATAALIGAGVLAAIAVGLVVLGAAGLGRSTGQNTQT